MTKETYIEMCEMLGQEISENDMPVEYGDLPDECQTAILIYSSLRDEYQEMSNTYLGKSLLGLLDLFNIYDIEHCDRKLILSFIEDLDVFRKKQLKLQKASEPTKSPEP